MTAQARTLGGRYQVGELLGHGGMAEVRHGRDLRLGRPVAIKMLRQDLARDATFQARFRREAQNAASLNHPAIVAIYDTGEDMQPDGTNLPYIVMEFVNGRTLKEVLAAEGPLMPRRALEITADICAALEFSHRHGIIHRDIKPGNVMLNATGQVKVMDFGIARALASTTSTMTATSAVIGTAQYLSPEQARGATVDPRSDVYATGCVLYELITGSPPFVGDSPVSVAYQHVREDPRPPSELNPDVPPPVDAVVLKALAKNPANRYQSAAEMRADTLRAAAGRPVQATPVLSPDERTQIIGAARPRPHQGAHVAQPMRPPPRRGNRGLLAALIALVVFAVAVTLTGLYLLTDRDQVVVPNVVGKPADQAQTELEGMGLKVERRNVQQDATNPPCQIGNVHQQDPAADTEVSKDSTVHLAVCTGPNTVPVPQLVGSTLNSAKSRLAELNLQAEVVEVDNQAPKDQVIGTDPKEGTTVPERSKVKLMVSRGNMRPVPRVIGDSEDVARGKLQAAGFRVTVTYRTGTGTTVVDQSPRPDTFAKVESTVTIVLPSSASPSPSGSPTGGG